MSAVSKSLNAAFENAADTAGIIHWRVGDPNRYHQRMKDQMTVGILSPDDMTKRDLQQIAGFEPALLFGFAEPYSLAKDETTQGSGSAAAVGTVSPMAWGRDYHRILHERAACWVTELEKTIGPLQSRLCVDTTPLVDRLAAEVCGLGLPGRNGFVIHPQLGTAWNIGVVLLAGSCLNQWFNEVKNEEVQVEKVQNGSVQHKEMEMCAHLYEGCKMCRACIAACPTGALRDGQSFQVSRCLSAVTQKKGDLTELEMDAIGTKLYGCDVCQSVCPSNKVGAVFTSAPKLPLLEILGMTKSTYRMKYQDTGFYWRGLSVMKRNALIVLGNLECPLSVAISDCQKEHFVLEIDGVSYHLNHPLLPYAERLIKKNKLLCSRMADK